MGKITAKMFSGNAAFEAATAYVADEAFKGHLTDMRAAGSNRSFRQAVQSAQANTDVKQCGKRSMHVIVTLDDSDFARLEVLCGANQIFTLNRGGAASPRSHSGKSTKPAVKPITPKKPTKPVAKPVTPKKPTKPAAKPVTPKKPTKPATKPATPKKPTKPAAKPVTPKKPTKPAAKPVTPKKPTKPVAKPVSKPPVKKPAASGPAIDAYITGLNYDPRVILSIVPDGTTSALPVKGREAVGNAVIICTTTRHTLQKNLSEVAILSPAAGVIFPGALIRADQDMMDGHPQPIVLPRAKVTLNLDLPGLKEPGGQVVPTSSNVMKYLNKALEEWNKIPASQGYVNAARSILQVSQSFSSQQVALELGFKAEWASGNASAQVGVASTTEKSVVVAYFKQVFYTISMDPPETPSKLFAASVTVKQAQQAFDEAHPPAYVRSIDYGRILMIKMESSKVDTALNLKAAFQQASMSGSIDASYREIIQNSTFTVLAIGGGAETPVKMFSGSSETSLRELQAYIAADAVYRRDNPGLPIAYTVAFLKDNSFAIMGSSADYTETVCVRFNNGFVRFDHAGGYVAKFEIDWVEPDAEGNYTVNRQWTSGEKTAGYSESIDIPGDAKNVHLKAWAMTGLVWDPWGEILNIVVDGPDNKTYRVTGTTLDRHWDNPTS